MTILQSISDEARTHKIADGWDSTFGAVNGVQKTNVFKLIEAMKKDEGTARVKMDSCQKGYPAPPLKRKDAEKHDATKNAIASCVKQIAVNSEKDGSEDEEENETTNSQTYNSRNDWLKSPEMVLLSAIAHNSRID